MAGPAVAMAVEEPMNKPAPMMPAMEIIDTWRDVSPCCSERCFFCSSEAMFNPQLGMPPRLSATDRDRAEVFYRNGDACCCLRPVPSRIKVAL
ncbi:hypothetical protein D3C77_176560 [compost metagenome]